MILTATTIAGINDITCKNDDDRYYWIKNKGSTIVHVSAFPDIAVDGSNTAELAPGDVTLIENNDNHLYVLGAGKIEIHRQDFIECPFKVGQKGGDVITSDDMTFNAVDYPLVALNLYGKSVQNGTPTPDAPVDVVSVGDDGAVEITACGKNLLPYPYKQTEISINGGTIKASTDGSLTFEGTPSNQVFLDLYRGAIPKWLKNNVTLSLQGQFTNVNIWLSLYDVNNNTLLNKAHRQFVQCNLNDYPNASIIAMGVKREENNIAMTGVGYPQLELGTTATEYEPYKVNTGTLTSGLPLCSIGEYRDELIYNADGTGKIIKKTNIVYLDGSSDEYYTSGTATDVRTVFGIGNIPSTVPQSQTLCNITSDISITPDNITITTGNAVNIAFGVNLHIETIADLRTWLAKNPMTIIYILKTPQEITLSAAEMAELQKLQTFDGMTNIHNNEGAEMTVKVATNPILSEYVKPVIDGITARIENLEAAVLSLGSNV